MKRKEDNNYILYKAENIENGLTYIGATTYSVEQRKLDHVERAIRGEANKFHKAIGTYGADAFEWEQIDTASSTDELAIKEKQYIIEYKAKDEGYNSDSGGGFKKTVYKYSLLDGSLQFAYNCLEDAANSIGSTKQHISRACLSINNTYCGHYWSYELKEPFRPTRDKRFKKVIQFSLEGEKMTEYSSVAEASRGTGISKTCISRCCRGERGKSSGFLWKYL